MSNVIRSGYISCGECERIRSYSGL
jgi:hypothetical protein